MRTLADRYSGAITMARMAKKVVDFVLRPFEGLPDEAGWVAMREIVPSATGHAKLDAEHGGSDVLVVTVLPGGYSAMHRPDGTIMLSLQDAPTSPDVSRDLAAALLAAVAAAPGTAIPKQSIDVDTPRLQDILDVSVPFDRQVHDNYEFWLDKSAERTPQLERSLREASDSSTPTTELADVPNAFWCQMNHEFLRWVREEDEDTVVDALARLQAARELGLDCENGEARFLGMFRADGLTVPVWQLPDDTGADGLKKPMAKMSKRLDKALASDKPLTGDERRARAGILSRQVTLR